VVVPGGRVAEVEVGRPVRAGVLLRVRRLLGRVGGAMEPQASLGGQEGGEDKQDRDTSRQLAHMMMTKNLDEILASLE
jgi:hypothetical protein